MNLTHHHVYYVFDMDDVHYTNTMLRLRPETYLWHELRSMDKADFCLSLSFMNSQLQVRTFDSSSRELLSLQKGLWWNLKTKQLREEMKDAVAQISTVPLQKLPQQSGFWEWLDEMARKFSNCTFSILVTHDAVSEMAAAEKLLQLPSNCTVMIRFPAEEEKLESIAHGPGETGFPAGMCTETMFREQMPLMEALNRGLGERMICLFPQREDITNLLLYSTLREDNHDSPAQLRDQAEYLYLLWSRRRMHRLDSSRYPEESVEWVRLSTIAADLGTYWPVLREQVERLRRKYGDEMPMESLMYYECLLPTEESVIGAYRTTLGNQLLQIRKLLMGSQAPAKLKILDLSKLMDIAVIWNKRRNEAVEQAAEQYCQKALMAIGSEHWDELEVMLHMLRFCADFVCAEPEKVPNMQSILNSGNEIFEKMQRMKQSEWARAAFTDETISDSGSYKTVLKYTQTLSDMLTKQQYEQMKAETQAQWIALKQSMQACYGLTGSTEKLENTLVQIQGVLRGDSSAGKKKETHSVRWEVDQLLYENGLGSAPNYCDDDDYEDAE